MSRTNRKRTDLLQQERPQTKETETILSERSTRRKWET